MSHGSLNVFVRPIPISNMHGKLNSPLIGSDAEGVTTEMVKTLKTNQWGKIRTTLYPAGAAFMAYAVIALNAGNVLYAVASGAVGVACFGIGRLFEPKGTA